MLRFNPFYFNTLSFVFLFFTTSIQAQDSFGIVYTNDSSSLITISKEEKIPFVFSCPEEFTVASTVDLEWTVGKASISFPALVKKASDKSNRVFGELPQPFFTKEQEGYLAFGKEMLTALRKADKDSIITIQTKVVADFEDINGLLRLSMKNFPGLYQTYWEEVEYYWLLDRQIVVEDSIKKLTADAERGKALLAASSKFVDATKHQIDLGEKGLHKNHQPFNASFESLKKINIKLDDFFDATKVGTVLSEEDKKQIAYLTTDASELKKEIKKTSEGREALEAFEKVSKLYTQQKTAKTQQETSNNLFQGREQSLSKFKEESKHIQKRLKDLKRILKM